MRRAAVLAGLALAGCGGGASDSGASDEQVIRGWIGSLNSGDFEAAADSFAENAIVEQVEEARLRTRRQAIAFNRSLPCRADLVAVDDAGGGASVGTFDLRTGRTGACREGGTARVRFVIEEGLIVEWRQLPEAPLPPDAETACHCVAAARV